MTHHLKAALVFPSEAEPIANGMVSIEDGVIAAVGAARREPDAVHLGNTAIIAGLVNAHAHLELTEFDRPLGWPGIGMAQWIELLLAHREQSAADGAKTAQDPLDRWAAVRRGLAESIGCGVTQLADIAAHPWPAELTAGGLLDCVVCREIIAPTPERLAGLPPDAAAEFGLGSPAAPESVAVDGPLSSGGHLEGAASCVDETSSPRSDGVTGSQWSSSHSQQAEYRRGLSLHAPYTVLPELWPAAARQSERRRQLLAVHLAESQEEIELMASGGGPLRALLESRGAWSAGLWPGPRGPGDYLRMLEKAHRLLIIHGNYLDADSLELLGRWRDRAAVVFCPRTHRWFRHRRYPLAEMLDRGIALAVGTDSRASSPDLNFWAELQAIAADYPEVPLPRVLALGTAMGAAALGRSPPWGRLVVGAPAILTFVGLPPGSGDPFARLFDGRSRPVGRWLPGSTSLESLQHLAGR